MNNRISQFHRIKLTVYIFSITFLLSVNSVQGGLGISNFASETHFFTENQGQFNDKALFRAKIPGGVAWFTSEGVTYSFSEFVEDNGHETSPKRYGFYHGPDQEAPQTILVREYLIRVVFVGANSDPEVLGLEKLEFVFNYFIGSDATRWRTHVP
ncbi:MAG: hypothetical protein IH914_11500, partial [candidate division Zixibacteria bacterium]|nr:hypothetical protein [candidate division Zixibacteria bacterium]